MIKVRSDLKQIINFDLPTVEIGVAEGLFSRDILSWGSPKHYMVDAWQSVPNATGDIASDQSWHDRNLDNVKILTSPYGEKAVILKGFSGEMADKVENNSVGFIYVDGGHAYHVVKQDILKWYPKLVSGGIMAFHDFLHHGYGVGQAVKEFCHANKIQWHLIPDISDAHAGAYFYKP
jgi:hypothetical protein